MNQANKTRAAVMMGAGVVLMLAAVIFFLVIKPGGPAARLTPTPNIGSDIPYPNVPRVEVDDAKDAFDQNAAVFVDTRSEEMWSQYSIPLAFNIPEDEIEERYTELDPGDWIILYCT